MDDKSENRGSELPPLSFIIGTIGMLIKEVKNYCEKSIEKSMLQTKDQSKVVVN